MSLLTGGARRARLAAAAALIASATFMSAGCGPSDPVFSVKVTNKCDFPVSVALIDDLSMLDDAESMRSYDREYAPGQSRVSSTAADTHNVVVVAGLASGKPEILGSIEVSVNEPAGGYTVSGGDCEAARAIVRDS